jgi:hypothetical protein
MRLLKQSSVKRVQKRMKYDTLKTAPMARKNDVHNPIQLYMGKNGRPAPSTKRYSAPVKASVSPVGPRNVSG